MVRLAAAIVLVALPGCSAYFGLDSPALVADAATDGALADALADAATDTPIAGDTGPAACPANYAAIGGGHFRQVSTPTDWLSAQQDCADDGATGGLHTHLIVLDNMQELNAANAILTGDAWIGLSDRVTEGTFLWVTAEDTSNYPPATGAPWDAGGPSGGATTDCVLLRGTGVLSDVPCTNSRRYVCECDEYASDPLRY